MWQVDNLFFLLCSEINSQSKKDKITLYDINNNGFAEFDSFGSLKNSQETHSQVLDPIGTIVNDKYVGFMHPTVEIFKFYSEISQKYEINIFMNDELTFFKQYSILGDGYISFHQQGQYPIGHIKNSFNYTVKNKYVVNNTAFLAHDDTYEVMQYFWDSVYSDLVPVLICAVGLFACVVMIGLAEWLRSRSVFREEEELNWEVVRKNIERIKGAQKTRMCGDGR
jgi:hypothetical protein